MSTTPGETYATESAITMRMRCELLWLYEEVWPLICGIVSRPDVRDRFKALPTLINARVAFASAAKPDAKPPMRPIHDKISREGHRLRTQVPKIHINGDAFVPYAEAEAALYAVREALWALEEVTPSTTEARDAGVQGANATHTPWRIEHPDWPTKKAVTDFIETVDRQWFFDVANSRNRGTMTFTMSYREAAALRDALAATDAATEKTVVAFTNIVDRNAATGEGEDDNVSLTFSMKTEEAIKLRNLLARRTA